MHRSRTRAAAAATLRGPAALALTLALVVCCASPPPPTLLDRGGELLDDRVALLGPDGGRRVRAYLAWVGEEYGVDYHVVIDDLGGESIERRALALFAERGGEGPAQGRALLLLVDPARELVRVEVGYALEPYVTDLAASRLLADYLAPHFRAGDPGPGIEASIEALVDELRPHLPRAGAAVADGGGEAPADVPAGGVGDGASRGEGASAPARGGASPAVAGSGAETRDGGEARAPAHGSGGGGASLDLLRSLPDGTPDAESRRALAAILVPQPDPRAARALEIALLEKGIYAGDAALYDAAWRRSQRPGSWSPSRLREIGRQWNRPFEVAVEEPRAVAYYRDAPALGPTFLRQQPEGWIIDATATAATVVYDYSNEAWYARDEGSPYLTLLRRAIPLRRVALRGGGAAWTLQ